MTDDRVPHDRLGDELGLLHEDYVERVNAAVEHDREDLAVELADVYAQEALRLITVAS